VPQVVIGDPLPAQLPFACIVLKRQPDQPRREVVGKEHHSTLKAV
jgi:hypothetical protein